MTRGFSACFVCGDRGDLDRCRKITRKNETNRLDLFRGKKNKMNRSFVGVNIAKKLNG